MRSFIQLFKKVDGFRILRQYKRGHVLSYALLMVFLNGTSQKSLEIVRLAVGNRLLGKLRIKYKKTIDEFAKLSTIEGKDAEIDLIKSTTDELDRKVWVCWLQGMENAPDIVKVCYNSLLNNIKDREIILVTRKNYGDFVQFPEYIQKKFQAGILSRTHMSDLLRLELLKKYGGTWIDATVLLTGILPDYMLDSKLFLFQNLKPGLDGHCTGISNWFITAAPGNRIIELTLALLYEYWRRNNELVDYYIFHNFFQIAIEAYPEEWKNVIPYSNSMPHILLLRLFDEFDEKVWKAVKGQGCVHKLSYKFGEEEQKKRGTYYRKLMEDGL